MRALRRRKPPNGKTRWSKKCERYDRSYICGIIGAISLFLGLVLFWIEYEFRADDLEIHEKSNREESVVFFFKLFF